MPPTITSPEWRPLATYQIQRRHRFRLIIVRGNIIDFSHPTNPQRSAIVNSASREVLSRKNSLLWTGDEAICRAGGPSLMRDRQGVSVRSCPVGSAVATGPYDSNGILHVPYVIHAVGPNYRNCITDEELFNADKLLSSAYLSSLKCGEQNRLEAIAFSLLSAGTHRLPRTLENVLEIGLRTIWRFWGYAELKEVYLCGFTETETDAMLKTADAIIGFPCDERVVLAGQQVTTIQKETDKKKPTIDDFPAVDPKSASEGENPSNSIDSGDDEEHVDALGQLVNAAAIDQIPNERTSFRLPTNGTNIIPNSVLNLAEPQTPSDLTLDTYFRRDLVVSLDTKSVSQTGATASLSKSTYELSEDDLKEISDARTRLNDAVESVGVEPIQLPIKYVETIKSEKLLGGGYFGQVCLGVDEVIGKRFAVKVINPLVLEQSLSNRLESIQNSFRNEIKVLSQLRHPNIAKLYGYCMEDSGLNNTCLIYELANNGSLDTFWANKDSENRLGRERLSEAKVRTRIALEVATVLRYMHEGLDGGTKCFHRDIKSANICLAADLSVRVIDCGLSKYVTESEDTFSSVGATGTPGYTCPQYVLGEIPFGSACDVFSFGVLICELITSQVSSRRSQHFSTYKRIQRRRLEDDADECVHWTGGYLDLLSKLALECLEYEALARPSIGQVVEQLQNSLNNNKLDRKIRNHDSNENDGIVCRLCGEVNDKYIMCFGSQKHVHCHHCFEGQLMRNVNGFKYDGVTCPKEGCDSRPFRDDEASRVVSQNVWNSYLSQRNSDLFQSWIASMERRTEDRIRQMQELQVKLCAGNGLPCPKLFLLVEADRNVKLWRNPKEWVHNALSVKLYLYFVCSHSLQPVSDECRIKVRYTRDWLRAIAPALNASLEAIRLSLSLSLHVDSPLDFARIQEMDEWAKSLLEPADRNLIEESHYSRSESESSLQILIGNSLSKVAEKAASSNISWQKELVPVFDFKKNEPTFVKSDFASEYNHRRE